MNEIELLTAYRQEMHKIQIKNGFTDEQMTSYRQGFMDAIGEYERRIATDVQPVKHGRWTYPYKDKDINQCSECRSCVQDKINNVREMFAYCPFCGAKMDGDTE